jgi:hypothetical protein
MDALQSILTTACVDTGVQLAGVAQRQSSPSHTTLAPTRTDTRASLTKLILHCHLPLLCATTWMQVPLDVFVTSARPVRRSSEAASTALLRPSHPCSPTLSPAPCSSWIHAMDFPYVQLGRWMHGVRCLLRLDPDSLIRFDVAGSACEFRPDDQRIVLRWQPNSFGFVTQLM